MRKAAPITPFQPAAGQQCFDIATLMLCIGLAVFTLLTFWPVQEYGFVNYDDPEYVYENPMVMGGVTTESVSWAFRSSEAANWHPLTWLSHMLDVELFGLNPGAHHRTSLLLHTLNGILLFLCVRKLTGAQWPSLIVAAIFAVHPLRIESVAWISERKDVLTMTFGLLAIWAYAHYATTPLDRRQARACWYSVALLTFAMALMAKPMLVTLPFIFLLLDFWPLHRLGFSRSRFRDLVLEKIPFLALTVISCAVTFFAQQKGGAVESLAKLPLDSRIANAIVSYPRYVGTLLWPVDLAVLYPPRAWPIAVVAGAALFLVAMTVLVIVQLRTRPYLAVGWLWFAGSLVPVIGIVQVGLQSMADRYTYFPAVGLVIMTVWGIQDFVVQRRIPRLIPQLATAAVLCGCIAATRAQLPFWQNSETLFERAISITENNHIAWNNYARALPRTRSDEAMRAVEKALQIDPNYVDALNNLATELSLRERREEAIATYEKVLKLDPRYVLAYNNLGVALVAVNRVEEAIRHYRTSLRLKPDYVSALNNLGHALALQGKTEEAMQQFRAALKWDPNHIEARENLANALSALNLHDEAVAEYQAVLRSDPDRSDTCNRLGVALAIKGDLPSATRYFRKAIELDNRHISAHNNLARALAQQGRADDALRQYDAALAVDSANIDVRGQMAELLLQLGRPTEALAQFVEALKLAPADPRLHFQYGLALQKAGETNSAAEQFREALRLKPDYAEPQAALAGINVR